MNPFGDAHKNFERKGQLAIGYLATVKNGEVPNAIYHPQDYGHCGFYATDGKLPLAKFNCA